MNKKKVLGILSGVILLLLIILVAYIIWGLSKVSNDTTNVTFVIEPGESKTTIAKNLAKTGLIHNEYVVDCYLFFNKANIQAGEYSLNKSMSVAEIIQKFSIGDIKVNTVNITFVEGKRLSDYAKLLEENLKFSSTEFLSKANDTDYLKSLVSSGEYWFLTSDILTSGIYYPLEGYLYPDTYEFRDTATPSEVIETMLKHTLTKLDTLKDRIAKSGYTTHQVITIASIVEKEANTLEDRKSVAQVIYTRLKDNASLGSDVTAFYGARKEMGVDAESWEVLNDVNPYNTRLTDGTMNGKLPIGPICNPSMDSIMATLEPSDTNYYYFVADTCNGKVYFETTSTEFYQKVKELQSSCATN